MPHDPTSHRAAERFWRSIEEAHGKSDVQVPGWSADHVSLASRRRFMQWMAASVALGGVSACSRTPLEHIVPYRTGPSQTLYGKPVFYATALARNGYATGVLVECNMGRPTKIEGNPAHPASLGATDAITQAEVLELWNPDRSQAVLGPNGLSTWDACASALRDAIAPLRDSGGEGLHILTETVASPSVFMQLDALRRKWPALQWHQYQPITRANVHEGARLAYGSALETIYRFDRARVIVALDADFLSGMPGAVRHAHDFSTRRNALVAPDARSRLYALESTPTLTGAAADHRTSLRASDVARIAQALAHALDAAPAPQGSLPVSQAWLDALVADLKASAGASIVVAGEHQPPVTHAIAHTINTRLRNVGSTLTQIAPIAAEPVDAMASLRDLATSMHAGRVRALLILDGNPVYTAPPELDFAHGLRNVPFAMHLGLYRDETAHAVPWHVPARHALETWGDVRAFDGTVSIQQPCIAPLYAGSSLHGVLAALGGDSSTDARDIVRSAWLEDHPAADSEAWWRDVLRSGVVPDSASPPAQVGLASSAAWPWPTPVPDDALEVVLAPDPRIDDGRYANNAWLQELPKPLTQLTWDNAALVSPGLASRLGLASGDVVELVRGKWSARAPVWITPGQPDATITLHLGYGRTHGGEVGRGRGFDAYLLRGADAALIATGIEVRRTGEHMALASTQSHSRMEGRDIVRMLSAKDAQGCVQASCGMNERPQRTLYDSPPQAQYAWAMSIDLSACVGCGACTIACQAENNIPSVGKEEVANGREMHWIRVDRYYTGSPVHPRTVFQPVPCMHCEHAPCEVVCPVEAAVHDAQGLNVQVYNRCVGTRFCSNNCPYKVRRFNFLQYSRDEPHLDAQRNPEVTVRMRGVMEKCNYCLQRITNARIEADKEGRRIRDGEVVTACQAVCPTRAIVFGDLADPGSEVRRRKASPLDYTLLAELNTRPRTTYLPRIVNPSPALPDRDA